ncbi:MAG TPA: methionine synthase, partial [Trebonia sp.]|nr:methionine synthase [Trebonia sp.]
SSDLDALEEALDGFDGLLKVQLAGPWTLAATLEQSRSLNPALADPGLVADLAASLAEGIAAHAAEVAKRLPRATLVVQLDEPALPAVITGAVPTASGLGRVRAPEEEFLRARLAQVISATQNYTVVHCCGHDVPFGIIMGAGAAGVSFDMSQLRIADLDKLAETAEAGAGLLAGVPFDLAERSPLTPDAYARSIAELWRKLTLPAGRCPEQVVVTPACGLAGASPARARAVLGACRDAGRILADMMGELWVRWRRPGASTRSSARS